MPGEGINTQGHVLVNKTADGVDLNLIWAEIETLLEMWNGERTTVASLISYPTTVPADAVPQTHDRRTVRRGVRIRHPQRCRAAARLPQGRLHVQGLR